MTRRTATIIGGIGQTLIALGLCVLLFAGFQLWGTGLYTNRAQDDLESQFAERLAAVDQLAAAATAEPTTTTEAPTGDGPISDDQIAAATTQPRVAPELAEALLPARGEAAGRIEIPRIAADWIYLEGVDRTTLRKGPGHYPGSPLPGQAGNAAIAGHRTTNGAPFQDLDQLEPGDPIIVSTVQGEFRYEVIGYDTDDGFTVGHRIVAPSDVDVVEDQGDNRITLTACHPKLSARQRIVVSAVLVSDPGEPLPVTPLPEEPTVALADGDADTYGDAEPASTLSDNADAFSEGLGWHMEERNPAMAWGLAALVVATIGAVAGYRWRKWPAYALTLFPFAPLLFQCYVHLDRLLPAF